MRLCSEKKIVPILAIADVNAGVDGESINVKGLLSVAFIITFSTTLAGAAGMIFKLFSGVTDGAKTTALTFNYRYGGAACKSALADVLSAEATSAALTCTSGTFVSRILIVEVDLAGITDGHYFLTPEFGAEADAGGVHCVAIGTPKYASPAADTILS